MTDSDLFDAAAAARDPLYRAAAAVCENLLRRPERLRGAPPATGLAARLRRVVGAERPAEALARWRADLGERPGDRAALWRLARGLEAWGYADLAAVVLCQLHKCHPSEPETPAVLGRLFLARGRRPGRPAAARLKDYERAVRYLARAAALADRPSVAALRTAAMVESTVLKGSYDLAAR